MRSEAEQSVDRLVMIPDLREQIIGRLQAENIEALSDAEIDRCMRGLSPRIIAVAHRMMDMGLLADMKMNPYREEPDHPILHVAVECRTCVGPDDDCYRCNSCGDKYQAWKYKEGTFVPTAKPKS